MKEYKKIRRATFIIACIILLLSVINLFIIPAETLTSDIIALITTGLLCIALFMYGIITGIDMKLKDESKNEIKITEVVDDTTINITATGEELTEENLDKIIKALKSIK